GVLYHHFPGGKTELAIAAIQSAVSRLTSALDRLIASGADPVAALSAWMAGAEKQLEKGRFEKGCPLATVALESTAEDETIRGEIAAGFAAIRDRLSSALVASGVVPAKARALSTLIVSAYEGALMQARVAGSLAPMTETASALLQLIQSELDAVKGIR
ncbi:MAG: TetR family transcriptional regulator C-terminal domain-containing protein, partial [Acidobacteria bacterium]|nr:TetR family transcriptional regulator C-terminal domain-containing protein [Acidobacteriota bacterium]